MYDYSQDNLSVATQCNACLMLESKCSECREVSEAKASNLAWQLVDDGNDSYRYGLMYIPLLKLSGDPSGHDWTDRDGEFLPPIHLISDGGELDNLWELEDQTQRNREVVCHWCQLLTPKAFNDCQVCDKPLEANVR